MKEKRSVILRPLCLTDKELIFNWISDTELRKMTGTRGIPNIQSHNAWFENKLLDQNNELLIIESNNKPVGIIGTNVIDRLNFNAEMYLYIGEKNEKGKGIATIAVNNFVQYLVEKYDLHKITARIFSFNLPSIRLFEKCGFQLEGIQKEHIYQYEEGSFADLLWYAIIVNKRC